MVTITTHYARGVLVKVNRTRIFGIVALLVLALLLPMVVGTSKPIAGKLDFTGQITSVPVNVYVEIDSPIEEKQTCITYPPVMSGPDGSFATNLENLVSVDFTSVRCNSFWKKGDKIWFEISSGSNTYSSEIQQIIPGTGLQRLGSLSIGEQSNAGGRAGSSSGGGASSSSGSGGGATTPRISPQKEIPAKLGQKTSPVPDIQLKLIPFVTEKTFDTSIVIEISEGAPANIILKIVLFSLPDNHIVQTIEDSLMLSTRVERSISLMKSELDAGHYKLQAFAYTNDKLVAVSNIGEFYTQGNVPPIRAQSGTSMARNLIGKAIKVSAEAAKPGTIPFAVLIYGISFLLMFVALLFFLRRKR